MRYIDCLIMNAGLMDVNATGMKARFSYAVSRNKQLLEPVIKSLEDMVAPDEDHKKFTDERQKLLEEFAKKDEDGNPIVQMVPTPAGEPAKSFVIPGINDKDNDFNKRLAALTKKHKAALDNQEAKEKEYNKYLDEPVSDFSPIKVKWNLVPDGLSQKAMDGVFFMIEEEKPEKKPSTPKKK